MGELGKSLKASGERAAGAFGVSRVEPMVGGLAAETSSGS